MFDGAVRFVLVRQPSLFGIPARDRKLSYLLPQETLLWSLVFFYSFGRRAVFAGLPYLGKMYMSRVDAQQKPATFWIAH